MMHIQRYRTRARLLDRKGSVDCRMIGERHKQKDRHEAVSSKSDQVFLGSGTYANL